MKMKVEYKKEQKEKKQGMCMCKENNQTSILDRCKENHVSIYLHFCLL